MTYFVAVKEKPESCEDCVFNCVKYDCPLKELPPKLPEIENASDSYNARREAWNVLIDFFIENAE